MARGLQLLEGMMANTKRQLTTLATFTVGLLAAACSGAGAYESVEPIDEPSEPRIITLDSVEPREYTTISGYVETAASIAAGQPKGISGALVCATGAKYGCVPTDDRGHYSFEGVVVDEPLHLAFGKEGFIGASHTLHTTGVIAVEDTMLIAVDDLADASALEGGALLVRALPMMDGNMAMTDIDGETEEVSPLYIDESGVFADNLAVMGSDGLALYWDLEPGTFELAAEDLFDASCSFATPEGFSRTLSVDLFAGQSTTVYAICSDS